MEHAGRPPSITDSVKHEHKQLTQARKKTHNYARTHEKRISGGPFHGKARVHK